LSEKQFVIIGLGNPGTQYEMTRHNMGALLVQGFAHTYGVALKADKRFFAKTAKLSCQGSIVHLVLPMTYMNESGQALRLYLDYYKLEPKDVIVACDDADLDFGQLRLRAQGSSGGHNGLKSIQKHLGSSHYMRLKLGIGRAEHKDKELKDHVLDRFSKMEAEKLPEIVEAGIKVLKMLLIETAESVMNVVNMRQDKDQLKAIEEKPKNTYKGDKQEEK